MLIEQLGEMLVRHPEIVREVWALIRGAPDPAAAERALLEAFRRVKKEISDQAMREELELTRGR